jgi:mannose-1-phosphate guanylyltransferase
MKMIVIAGGKGTRLRPITDTIPKPMVEVQGKPILEHILLHARQFGITEFIFALCYLPTIVTDYFGDGKKWDVKIDYIFEDENNPLGSAGAILEAKNLLMTRLL